MSQEKIILIGGPTASGKSALAMQLAQKHDGTIINADAMQIYHGLPLLSAQPSNADKKAMLHELYGVLDPSEASSAGKWLALVTDAVKKTFAAGRTPLLVGGTGLYFRSFLGGLADIPAIPDEVRAKAQTFYDEAGEDKFRAALTRLDPESVGRLARNDRQRLIRAYEVAIHTGRSLKEWQKNSKRADGANFDDATIEKHLLLPDRNELYAACDRRFLQMIELGAVDEVKNFLKRGLDPALPAMKTIGVREIGAYLQGEWSLDEAIAKSQQATRNYAKRQMTWFRNQGFGDKILAALKTSFRGAHSANPG